MAFACDATLQEDIFASESEPSTPNDAITVSSDDTTVSGDATTTLSSSAPHATSTGSSSPITKRRKVEETRFSDLYERDGDTLGSGAFGEVWPCIHRHTGERVAVKVVYLVKPSHQWRAFQEIESVSLFKSCTI